MQRPMVLSALALLAVTPLDAQSVPPQIQVHGCADWGVGHSSGGRYEFGSERGTARSGTFALVLSAVPAPRVSIVTQLGFDGVGNDVIDHKPDIVFAQYQLSDNLKFNVGRVQQPFGEYTAP